MDSNERPDDIQDVNVNAEEVLLLRQQLGELKKITASQAKDNADKEKKEKAKRLQSVVYPISIGLILLGAWIGKTWPFN